MTPRHNRLPAVEFTVCPVDGCDNEHRRDNLMCATHWSSLPKPLRDEVWRTYHSPEGILGEEYAEARKAAIDFCNRP